MHSENMLRDSPSVRMIFGALGSQFLFGALGSYNLGALGSLKIWCCVQKLVVSSQNFEGLRFSFFVSCVYLFLVVAGS